MHIDLQLPPDYRPCLSPRECAEASAMVRADFEARLARALNLKRVAAPLLVPADSGLNDDLNGVERPVTVSVRGQAGPPAEVVQSLAKWKRQALARYGFGPGEGIYTDMNALRPDETLDNLHGVHVDQWDWERVILPGERCLDVLVAAVEAIYGAVRETERQVSACHPHIPPTLPERIAVVSTEELAACYPTLSPRQREDRVCARLGAVFLVGIGADLPNGAPHDGRAPDYDDWSTPRPDGGHGLNGDILLFHPGLDRAVEISSMGIRVDPPALRRQLGQRRAEHRAELPFHRELLAGRLPQTMGGGIGQSRLVMCLLRAVHIGEVSAGFWPAPMRAACDRAGVTLL